MNRKSHSVLSSKSAKGAINIFFAKQVKKFTFSILLLLPSSFFRQSVSSISCIPSRVLSTPCPGPIKSKSGSKLTFSHLIFQVSKSWSHLVTSHLVTSEESTFGLGRQDGLCYKALSRREGKSPPPFGRPQKSRFHSFVTRLVFPRIRVGNA